MANWLDRIASSLKTDGYESRVWKAGSGRLLATPHAARLLGGEIEGVEGNLFWHHPDIEKPGKAGACLNAGPGAGGDRLWLSPEVSYMWEDLAQARIEPFENYKLPKAMDPADWRIVEDAPGHLRLATEIAPKDYR